MNAIRGFKKKYESLSIQSKAGIWFAFCGIVQKGINFITVPIFTRILSVEQYGQISVYLSWYNIVGIFLTLNLFYGGFNNGMIQNEDKRDEYLSSMQGLVTVITAGMYLFYLITSAFWNRLFEMDSTMITAMFIEILIHSSLIFWSVRERFEFRYKKLVFLTIIVAAIPSFAAVLGIMLAPEEYGAQTKIYVNAISVVLVCLPLYTLNITKGHNFYNKEFWKFGIKFNIPLIPHYLSGIILNQADRIMISKQVGEAEAGIYSLAYSASMVLNVVTNAINQTFAPWLYRKLKDKDYFGISTISNLVFTSVAVFIGILIAFAPECILIFGGSSYYEAIWIIPSVAVSLYFNFVFLIFANIEFYFMKNKYITYASVGGAILNVILNYIGIKEFGYIIAGYTTLICYIIFAVCHYVFMKKIVKDELGSIELFNCKYVFMIGAILIVFGAFMLLIYNHFILRYISAIVLCLLLLLNKNKVTRLIMVVK